MSRLEDQYKSTIHELVQRVLKLEKWKRDSTGDSPLFDIANEHTPNIIGGDQNDYDPGFYDVLRVSSATNISITGLSRGQKGRFLEFINVGTGRLTFTHEDASSIAANRISTPYGEAVVLLTNARATFYYDSTNSRWSLSDAPNIMGTYGRSAVIASSVGTIDTVPTGADTVLTPDQVITDEWGYWDSANYRFQIPANENGLYLACFSASWVPAAAGGTLRQIRIMRNGASNVGCLGVPNIATINTNMLVVSSVRMSGGDYVEFQGRQDSGGDLDIIRYSVTAPVAFFSKLE